MYRQGGKKTVDEAAAAAARRESPHARRGGGRTPSRKPRSFKLVLGGAGAGASPTLTA
jgi:hypothetical protein